LTKTTNFVAEISNMQELIKKNIPQNAGGKKTSNNLFEVTEEIQLLTFLLAKIPNKSRHNVKALLRDKQVLVNKKVVTQFNHVLQPKQIVEIKDTKAPQEQRYKGLKIIFEDAHLIVIEKDEGTLSIATEKQKLHNAYSILSDHIKKEDPRNRIFVIHRLDRETSGLMMFAKSEKVQKLMQESWNATIQERTYLALTEGFVKQLEGTVESYLVENKALTVYSVSNPNLGKHAITHYETLKSTERNSLLKVYLETGRKNQIRVHMKDIGFPIVGDEKYGAKTDPINRLGLHAWVLSFIHPITQEEMYFETPIPRKFLWLF
jgi:23S rRNA pseudouridine1911/1915/1917 synthase